MGIHCAGALARIQSKAALVADEAQLSLVWDSTGDAMRLTDVEGKIIRANRAFCDLTRKSREEIEGQFFSSLYSSEFESKMYFQHRTRFAKGTFPKSSKIEVELWDGRLVCLEMFSSFISNSTDCPMKLTLLRSEYPD